MAGAFEISDSAVKQFHTSCNGGGMDSSDVVLATALISMYGKCGRVEDAWTLADSLVEPDLVLYNAMIGVFSQNGHAEGALQLLRLMETMGMVPDRVTFVSILDACGKKASILDGQQVHLLIIALGAQDDLELANALLRMYGRCGRLDEVEKVFGNLALRDIQVWNSVIVALGQCGEANKVPRCFEEMQTEGMVPDNITYASLVSACADEESVKEDTRGSHRKEETLKEGTRMHARIIGSAFEDDIRVQNALVNMYGKCGDAQNARLVFDTILKPDVASWNALISAYAQTGQGNKIVGLYNVMHPECAVSDKATITIFLSAFAGESALTQGMLLHAQISDMGLSDISIGNALIHMYGKCGSIEDATHAFATMVVCDLVSWNAIIGVYAQHGQADMAITHLQKLISKGLMPDKVTMISALMACSHAGLIDEGYHLVCAIDRYGMSARTVDHYNCMVDLLRRAGRLHELESLMRCMPIDPTYSSWMTLLGACKEHSDLERGELAATCIMDIQPQECASLVLLSNMYASAGRWDAASKLREVIRVIKT